LNEAAGNGTRFALYVVWSRGQEGRFGQAAADAKRVQRKSDAGSPSDCDFPTAKRFRSSRLSEVLSAVNASVGPPHSFVVSSNLAMINTRTIGSVLTLYRHFHLFPLDPLARKREGSAEGATCSVAQSKRGWSISPKWFLAGATLRGWGRASVMPAPVRREKAAGKGDSHQIWRIQEKEKETATSNRGKPTIVSSVFHGAESSIPAPIAWPCP